VKGIFVLVVRDLNIILRWFILAVIVANIVNVI
jgi:hypothetical protein